MNSKMEDKMLNEFSDLQTSMLQEVFDFTGGMVQVIYVYGVIEDGILTFDSFVKKDNRILYLHQVVDNPREVSEVQKFGISKLEEVESLFKKHNKPVPTQIKLIYNVPEETLDGEYKYDLQFTNTRDKTADDIFDDWFDEEKKNE